MSSIQPRKITGFVVEVLQADEIRSFAAARTGRRGSSSRSNLELLRCHYNFVRLDGALKFGGETGTPAMQAGLATRRLTFREVFVCLPPSLLVSIGAITCAVPSGLPTAPIVDELLAAWVTVGGGTTVILSIALSAMSLFSILSNDNLGSFTVPTGVAMLFDVMGLVFLILARRNMESICSELRQLAEGRGLIAVTCSRVRSY